MELDLRQNDVLRATASGILRDCWYWWWWKTVSQSSSHPVMCLSQLDDVCLPPCGVHKHCHWIFLYGSGVFFLISFFDGFIIRIRSYLCVFLAAQPHLASTTPPLPLSFLSSDAPSTLHNTPPHFLSTHASTLTCHFPSATYPPATPIHSPPALISSTHSTFPFSTSTPTTLPPSTAPLLPCRPLLCLYTRGDY